MSIIDEMKAKSAAPKSIKVKVEDIDTGEIVKTSDCGTDQSRADKLETALLNKTNSEKYHVYQSLEI